MTPDRPSTDGLDTRQLARLEEMLAAASRAPSAEDVAAMGVGFRFTGPTQSRQMIEAQARIVLWLRSVLSVPMELRTSVALEMKNWLRSDVTDAALAAQIERNRRELNVLLEQARHIAATEGSGIGLFGLGVALLGGWWLWRMWR